MMPTRHHLPCLILLLALLLTPCSCREDVEIFIPEQVAVSAPEVASVSGFYLLNEGNMGSNKSTLDYYDYATGVYTRNIYGAANPSVPKELGDVGNDLAVYGSRLYAVINCSNKVEVMDARTAQRIGQVDIPNCRYIRFHDGYAYITSYAGPVVIRPDYEQRGFVAKVDTSTLQIVDTCVVGFQPDELEIAGGRLFVANSGGYMVPNYESTVSVIDLDTFRERCRIPVAINLHHIKADRHGQLWVSSRGDYFDIHSRLYCIDLVTEQVVDSIPTAVENFCLSGDSLYFYSTEWSYITMANSITYGIVDIVRHRLLTRNFITDGTEQKIRIPYGVRVNPVTHEILVTDAHNYVSPGTLYCFGPDGILRWSVRTGDIPAHIAFVE